MTPEELHKMANEITLKMVRDVERAGGKGKEMTFIAGCISAITISSVATVEHPNSARKFSETLCGVVDRMVKTTVAKIMMEKMN